METDKMSTASSVGAAERRPLLQALVIERRILFGCTLLVGLCSFIWIIAVSTAKWVNIIGADSGGSFITQPNNYSYCLLWSESGIWEICRHVFQTNKELKCSNLNAASTINCTNYLAPHALNKTTNSFDDPVYSVDIANYVRTMVSFAIIALFVMAMGCGFSVYTFLNPRYMFKRLAAGIHFISTSCSFVVVQVMMTAVDEYQKAMPNVYPHGATHYFHISFFLAWFVVLINLFASASFLWYSRKKKGDKAATDELAMADEPTIIGR